MMNEGFIHKVAEYVFQKHLTNREPVRVVFPNRRAGLFFNHAIASFAGTPVWAPLIDTIRGYIEELSGKKVSETMRLVMELHTVYGKVTGIHETFEDFYPWGEMLLGDFDDIDKYRVDARDLFRNLQAVQELSQDMSYLSDEQIKLIRQFWDHFPEDSRQGHAGKFIEVWEKLFEVYTLYRSVLEEKEMAYEGMLYREMGEMASHTSLDEALTEPLYLVGFNALTPAEEALFNYLKTTGKAYFFWDYDEAYLATRATDDLPGHDAGRFVRKYLKQFPPPADLGVFHGLLNGDKAIRVFSSPNRTAQAWVVQQVLEEWLKEDALQKERIAVVLGDEQLLLPVLHALPGEAGDVNVTMGYPLQDSPVFAFFDAALILLKNKSEKDHEQSLFYYQDVLNLLHNPLLTPFRKPEWNRWEGQIKKRNIVYLSAGEIPGSEMLGPLFSDPENPVSYAGQLLDVLYKIIRQPSGEVPHPETNLNIEVYYQLYLLVNRLNDFLEEEHLLLPVSGYLNLLLYLARQSTVSFYGEPLKGIQVMGVLETRLLDFDRVIILSVNEGNLPGPAATSSYIPYSLRKGFGLPAYEHRDAVYAYYFFRLMQRARQVVLVWHTESEGGQTGEKSRFISQLHYLTHRNMIKKNLYFNPALSDGKALKVEKDEIILQRLHDLSENKYLSPSALNTYLTCRLRFYFKYIGGIEEPEEMTEDVDAALFGRLLHKALEITYKPFLDVEVGAEILKDVLKKESIDTVIDKSFVEVLYGGAEHPRNLSTGLYLILKTSLAKYVRKALEYDRQFVPFTPVGLEQEVRKEKKISVDQRTIAVNLGGKIDRIDRSHDRVRLIDYKTGGEKLSFESIADLFNREKKDRNQAVFQILMYAWMYKSDPPAIPLLYFVRKMFSSDKTQQLLMGPSRHKMPFVYDNPAVEEYGNYLSGLLEDLFDPAVPFDQTKYSEYCKNCPTNGICFRQ